MDAHTNHTHLTQPTHTHTHPHSPTLTHSHPTTPTHTQPHPLTHNHTHTHTQNKLFNTMPHITSAIIVMYTTLATRRPFLNDRQWMGWSNLRVLLTNDITSSCSLALSLNSVPVSNHSLMALITLTYTHTSKQHIDTILYNLNVLQITAWT